VIITELVKCSDLEPLVKSECAFIEKVEHRELLKS
jgi:hypothetical protein